jgi:phosphoribosylamine--glycine ligase
MPAFDGDRGPNTGGMGAYCPTPLVTDELLRLIEERVLVPTVHQMKRSRRPFRGVLYAGLMITKQGVKVLEYNVRFGDPECQPILMRLKSDVVDLFEATVDGRLDEIAPLEWDPRPAVCVVMASEGYPGEYAGSRRIGAAGRRSAGVCVPHQHELRDGQSSPTAAGCRHHRHGRVVAAAKLRAYTAVKCIRWDGAGAVRTYRIKPWDEHGGRRLGIGHLRFAN